MGWNFGGRSSSEGGGDFTPSKNNLFSAVRDIFHPSTNPGVTEDTTDKELDVAAPGGSSFTPSKSNLYEAVKSIFHPATNAGVTADDDNEELDVAAPGGTGSFTPSKSNLFAAIKEIFHPANQGAVSADDTNNEIDISGDDAGASRIANALADLALAQVGSGLSRENNVNAANRVNVTASGIVARFDAGTYAAAQAALVNGAVVRLSDGTNEVIWSIDGNPIAVDASHIISMLNITYMEGGASTISTGTAVTMQVYALSGAVIGDRAFKNPPALSTAQQAAVRTAINAGTPGSGSDPIAYDKLIVYVNTAQLRQITGSGGPISFDGTEYWNPVGFGWIGDYSVHQRLRIYIEDGLAIPTGDFGLYTQTNGKVVDLLQANKQADENSVNSNLGEWAIDKNIVPLDGVISGLSLRQQSINSQITFNTLQTVVTPAQLAAMRSKALSFDGGSTTWIPDDIFFEPQGTSGNWHIWIVLPKNVYIPDAGDVTITYTGGPLTLTRANQQRVRTNVDALGEWSTYGFTAQEFFQRRAIQRDYTVTLRFWRDGAATPAAIPNDAASLAVDPESGLYAVNFPGGASNNRVHFALPQQYELGYVAIENRNRLGDFTERTVGNNRVYDVSKAISNTLEEFQMLIEMTVAA